MADVHSGNGHQRPQFAHHAAPQVGLAEMLKGGRHHGRDERGAGPHRRGRPGAVSVMALKRVAPP